MTNYRSATYEYPEEWTPRWDWAEVKVYIYDDESGEDLELDYSDFATTEIEKW